MKLSDQKKVVLKFLYRNKSIPKAHYIKGILTENNIEVSDNEAYLLGRSLEDSNYVNLIASQTGTFASIIADGIEYVEDELLDSSFTQEDQSNILVRLDQLAESLKKLELGQQITYDDIMDEFNELKELTLVLSKKNWWEVLHGKLLNLGLGHLADKVGELIEEVFDSKLLGS